MSKKPFVLVDGSSYLFRAFYALPNLTAPDGTPTGAMLGVINMLQRLLDDIDPEYIGVIFDAKGKTFRHEMFEAYKANRSAMPDELRVQIEPLHELVRNMGLPMVIESGVEADDVIGTLAQQAAADGHPVLISTGDKDIAQLVNEHITLVDTMKNSISDVEGVKTKYGVRPDQIIDYLTLIGDTSDNIPGVPKVGPKTAVKWLDQYETLDNIIEHADEIKGKVGENLREFLPEIPMSKKLVTIVCDVKLNETWDDLKREKPDPNALLPQFEQWGFKSWIRRFENQTSTDSVQNNSAHTKATSFSKSSAEPGERMRADGESAASTELSPERRADEKTKLVFDVISNQTQLGGLLCELAKCDSFAFDTETTSLDELKADLIGISIAADNIPGCYIPVGHNYMGAPDQLKLETVCEQLKPFLEDAEKLKVGQNLKYDIKVLSNYGIQVKGMMFDTMLASYVLEAGVNRHDMDTLAQKHLGVKTIKYEDVAGKGAKAIPFSEVPVETATPYAAEDAQVTLDLYKHFEAELQTREGAKFVFDHIEMPVVEVLTAMETHGVLIDSDKLIRQSMELEATIFDLQKQAFSLAGQEFNLGSPKQLQEILFEKMQIPVIKKTPTGQASTSEEVMQELAQDHELPAVILEFRHLSKLKSTYTDKLPREVNSQTGRVHTHYLQSGAATGRMASNNPNLQNIPVRTEQGRRIRQAFIAPEGFKLLAADYSQVELRIMAHLSGDKGLLDAFSKGEDVHRATAGEVFGVPPEQVTKDQRRHAKAINFGLMYGMSAFGLAKQLGIGRAEAKQYIDIYFERYPGVADFMDNTRKLAAEHGYVETLFGRRLYLPGIQSKNGALRSGAERAAINAPMQGTAADIIKKAMIAMHVEYLNDPDVTMIMQVHDELIFEVRESKLEQTAKRVQQVMQAAGDILKVPLLVDVGTGDNWDEAH